MLKELIQKKHSYKKSKSNERGSCAILPIYSCLNNTIDLYSEVFKKRQSFVAMPSQKLLKIIQR